MSVSVSYTGGRFGNCFTEYAAARLFAELNRLAFHSDLPPQDILRLKPPAPGVACKEPFIRFDDNAVGIFTEQPVGRRARYTFSGYFQRARFFAPHRERIKAWLDMPPVEPMPDDAVCMHVRLDDYRRLGWVIDPSWYEGILKTLGKVQVHIFSDELFPVLDWNVPDFNLYVNAGTPKVDFNSMRRFKTVLCSNSTFAWWAQFLGVCEKCYTFKPWVGPDSRLEMTKFPWAVEVDGKFWGGGK